jgi:hypothetical protein
MIDRQTRFLRRVRLWQPFLLLFGAAVWTFGTAAVAGIWTYYTYFSEKQERLGAAKVAQSNAELTRAQTEKIAAETRKLEAQRPFLQKKLDVYFETVQVAGRLLQKDLSPTSQEWKDDARRFKALRWGELEMVGDVGTRQAARRVVEQLDEVENNPDRDRHDLRWMVECLSDELRFALEHSWGYLPNLNRPTSTGGFAGKLPKGCVSTRDKPPKFPGMQDFEAVLNMGPRDEIRLPEIQF